MLIDQLTEGGAKRQFIITGFVDTTGEAEQLFTDLRKLSAKFLSIYFRLKRVELKS